MTTIRDILNRAAELVEHGWTQGAYEFTENSKTYYCLVGAIGRAQEIFSVPGRQEAYKAIGDRLRKDHGLPKLDPISRWNDAPGRTQAEVVALLREVASECQG